ncbi:uncharacterized protein LOC110974305 isoform X2 [Acanthaster planci]|uniref:Uncharacterized protein LOC110974305 isoform X2 n=1 Tax=Acanthaster planci TaxID=133434 RepID=A0A8B7XNH5_ACAPL|nr:uncharacterized protein LOC110974305 isoform X2 [Acanthaster planci]
MSTVIFRGEMDGWHRDVGSGQNHAAEVKTDLKLLLECLKCHMGDVAVQQDTLLTAAAVCSSSDEAKEFFRECGGINFVLNLLTSTEEDKVKIAALYMLGCACEKNVFSQKRLCTLAIFKFLYCQLIGGKETSDSLKRTSAFLLLCLVTNNGEGQNLARTSHCLEALLKLFRTSYPLAPHTSGLPGQMWMDSSDTDCKKQLDLWTVVTSTLSGCVNNPQNEANQLMCSSVAFATAIDIIGKTRNPTIIRLVSSFLSLTISNNVSNQDKFGLLGGLEAMVNLLHAVVGDLLQQPDQDAAQAAVQLANVFVPCITDCEQNRCRLMDLNLVPLLVQLMSMDFIESDVRLKIIITLGHLTEKCGRSQRQLLESDGLSLLVHLMADNQDEEFNKAAMYLLSSCIDLVSCMEDVGLNASDSKNVPKRPRSAEKRNKARAERESAFIPIGKQRAETEGVPDGNKVPSRHKNAEQEQHITTGVVHGDNANSNDRASSCSHRMTESTENKVINELLQQLHEEKSIRQRLEDEKKVLEEREEARARSRGAAKEAALVITKELERQYTEQKLDKTPEDEGEQPEGTKSATPEKQFLSPSMKNVEQRLEALEKSLNDISSVNNQLAEPIIYSRQRDQQVNDQDLGQKCAADGNKMSNLAPVTNIDQDGNVQLPKVKSKQLCDRVNKYIRNLGDGTDSVGKSQKTAGDALKTLCQFSEFRAPTSPVRRRQVPRKIATGTNQHILPSPNVIKLQRCVADLSRRQPRLQCSQYESDVESCLSESTDLSTSADTDMSMTASDMYLMKQAQPPHQMPHATWEHGPAPSLHPMSSARGRANRSYRVNYSWQRGPTVSVPVSRKLSELTNLSVSHHGIGRDSITKASKDVFTFTESENDLSGISSSECSNKSGFHPVPKCPGCAPPINRPLLNSRNFLYTLERSQHTCSEHRKLQRCIKQDLYHRRMAQTSNKGASPEFAKSSRSHLVRNLRSATRNGRSPHSITSAPRNKWASCASRRRRKRQEFSRTEICNLINGVAKKGKHWNCILWAYKFAPGRTAVDLKDKYRRMQAQNYVDVSPRSSSSSHLSSKQRQTQKAIDHTWRP